MHTVAFIMRPCRVENEITNNVVANDVEDSNKKYTLLLCVL